MLVPTARHNREKDIMYYLIYVIEDVLEVGIASGSEFELPAYGKGDRTLPEYVESELGLKPGQYRVL